MGFYIQTPVNMGKADWLIEREGAMRHDPHAAKPDNKVIVCVVENGLFDAAGIIYDKNELKAFAYTDPSDHRRRHWLLMDTERVIELCPEVESRLRPVAV